MRVDDADHHGASSATSCGGESTGRASRPPGVVGAPAPHVVIRAPDRCPIYLLVREPIEVGRHCRGIVVLDDQVSRRHLELRPVGELVQVTDLGSRNGTFMDGVALDGSRFLAPGSIVRLGSETTIELA
jgi:pSer/pThr/pTyr-binding forkhead associated (FHA) protein